MPEETKEPIALYRLTINVPEFKKAYAECGDIWLESLGASIVETFKEALQSEEEMLEAAALTDSANN